MKPKLLLPFLFLMAANLAAQNATITGVITDSETKDYLAGTTVVIKGTTKGTITDANGNTPYLFRQVNKSSNFLLLVIKHKILKLT